MSSDNFFAKVYQVVRAIPVGKVTTYGTIARLVGNSRMSRQVGWALHSNPDNSAIPCHRVVNRYGGLASAFVFGGINCQRQLLESEGVEVVDDTVDLSRYLWEGEQC